MVKVRWSFDERISDGFYCAASLRLIHEVFAKPDDVLGDAAEAASPGGLRRDRGAP
jgi:hypothetical protein